MKGLSEKEIIRRIERYLRRSDTHPRLVNVNNSKDWEAIRQEFAVGDNVFMTVADFANADENLPEDALINGIRKAKGNLFLTGFTSYYRLLGEDKLREFINRMSTISLVGLHLVVICYQCEAILEDVDRRYANFVYPLAGEKEEKPRLIFAQSEQFIPSRVKVVNGIANVANIIEACQDKEIYVLTKKHKATFPHSLFAIKEQNNAFEMIREMDVASNVLKASYGTEAQWNEALQKIIVSGSWAKYLVEEFGNTSKLENFVSNWPYMNETRQWLYFIALKLYGAEDNWCLDTAAKKADNAAHLVREIYRSLLAVEVENPHFWEIYDQRKKLIQVFNNPDTEVDDYCAVVTSKGNDVLYYLTDASRAERNLIFKNLEMHSEEMGRERIADILRHIYPALYEYLMPYRFIEKEDKEDLLNRYFNEYKYLKITNKISSEFMALVDEQAVKRDFNRILPPRSALLDAIPKENTMVYFIDAMGVEYLSYIREECRKRKLLLSVSICHCELPSLTSFNKEFVEAFEKGGSVFKPNQNGIKELDEIKHGGVEDFDFTNHQLPTYIPSELEVIQKTIDKIASTLRRGDAKRVVMISDHGASRLSVLYNSENKWEMATKGQHSGRCCPVNEIDEQPTCATEENGYWVLANYDRFKGGRKADVEVHGGATLEEVVVPIIVLTYSPDEIEVLLLDQKIKFSRRKKDAKLRVFSKTKLDQLSVEVSELNQRYNGISEDGQNFSIALPELKKAGTYHVDIYTGENLLKSSLVFKAVSSGMSEKNLL
jgi:hypothetical protein